MSGDAETEASGAAPAEVGALRQRAVDLLCEAFADDRMSVEEFERRVEVAHGARSGEELRGLLADLPGGGEALVPSAEARALARPGAPPTRSAEDRTWTLPPMARPEQVAGHGFSVGIMGGGGRSGRWVPARRNWGLAFMGGLELDFRDAVFPPGVTEVRLLAVWGGAEVVAPPGVRVEVSGVGLMGGFAHKPTVAPTDHPDAPVLRITGVACMGGVDVSVRYAGESGGDARRRLREETQQGKPSKGEAR